MVKVASKKLFRIWIVNAVLCVAGMLIYRYFIVKAIPNEQNFFFALLTVGVAILKVVWSQLFFFLMLFCGLTIFLNLNQRIVNSLFLSLLTFLLIPFSLTVYIIIDTVASSNWTIELPLFIDWIMPPIIYIAFTSVQFLLFRRYVSQVKNVIQ
ncbi:hypothetical protein MUGA111182_17365 [Mucilaginibacter galii]